MATDWAAWPSVPGKKNRPQDLFVAETLSREEKLDLERRGWNVVDVRVLPSKRDGDRVDAVKAWLHGVRVGSIQADKDVVKIIELEARAYGLVGTKQQASPTKESSGDDVIDDLLNFRGVKDLEKKLKIQDGVFVEGGKKLGVERKPCGRINSKKEKKRQSGYQRKVEPWKARRNREEREKREAAKEGAGRPVTTKFAPKRPIEYGSEVAEVLGDTS